MDKKASDLIVFEVAGLTTVADYFIICSADSQRQVRAIRDHIDDVLSRHGCRPFSTEGEDASRWVLMDYSDLVIHIFKEEVRSFYALERLWGDAPRVDPEEAPRPPARRPVKRQASVRSGLMIPKTVKVGRLRARKGW